MRKIVLGLFLAASSSCYVMANTIEIEDDLQENNCLFSTCYMQVIVNHETLCGVYVYSSASPKSQVKCFEGQTAGTTTTFYETRYISGWDIGFGPDKPTTCLN